MRNYDLEDRLIDFSVEVITLIEHLPGRIAAKHLSSQLVRSCTAPALIYGEAQAAESKRDFIHKSKLVLKELKESQINLKIINRLTYLKNHQSKLNSVFQECSELVAIFTTSIKTAKSNLH